MRKGNKNLFWLSYSDLMTSLFFIMLVLFIVCVSNLSRQVSETAAARDEANAKVEELQRLMDIERLFAPLVNDPDFKYLESSKKFIAKEFTGIEIFEPDRDVILTRYQGKTIEIGQKIQNMLKTMYNDPATRNLHYQVVLEGNVANTWDRRYSTDAASGYKLSYARALAVYNLWKSHGIDLRKYNAEILICGSGFNGIDRDPVEENNKRFSVQIYPKIDKN